MLAGTFEKALKQNQSEDKKKTQNQGIFIDLCRVLLDFAPHSHSR